jgi:hypothetical protein
VADIGGAVGVIGNKSLAWRNGDRLLQQKAMLRELQRTCASFRAGLEGKVMQNLLLGVSIGLLGALAVLTARYVAAVLAG